MLVPFRQKLETADYHVLSHVAPALAGDLAFLRFCTPKLSERRTRDHDILTARARYHLRAASWDLVNTSGGPVRTYTFNPASDIARGEVLIVHGWTSEASFMTVIAEQVRRQGFRAILMDCPAHGLSPGRRTSLVACAQAVAGVLNTLSAPRFVIAHSMGCLATLMALEGRAPMQTTASAARLVLISSPDKFQDVTQEHGDILGLTPQAQRVFERHLERLAHRHIASFRASALLAALNIPALLIHGGNDHEVLPRCSEFIAKGSASAELRIFDGLDHRRILYASPVIRAVLKFLAEV